MKWVVAINSKTMEKASEIRIVFATTMSFDNAQQISRILVTESLAACCSILHNVSSIFVWQGSIEERIEYMLIIKTANDKLNELESRIKELHTDDVPEIIAISLDSASGPYIDWLMHSIKL